MGDNTLALAAAFGQADLATLSDDADVGYLCPAAGCSCFRRS